MNIEQNTCEVTFHDKTYHCPISMVMDLIGGKWKTVILYYLKEESKRFNQLKRDMPDITEMTTRWHAQVSPASFMHQVRLRANM